MELIKCGLGDLDQVLALSRLFDQSEAEDEKVRKLREAVGEQLLWVACEPGGIVGYILVQLFREDHPQLPNSVFISDLFVLPEHRNKNIASELLNVVLNSSFPLEYKYFSVTHDPEEVSLTEFYKKFGFEVVGKTKAGNIKLQRHMMLRSKHAGEDWNDYKDFTENNQDVIFEDNVKRIFKLIENKFNTGDHINILEIGGGNGIFLERVADKLNSMGIQYAITLVEPNEALGGLAEKRCDHLHIEMNWVKSTAEDFFPVSDKYDLIICTRTVHHFSDTEFVIKEIHKCINERSVIFIYDLLRPADETELKFWLKRRREIIDHDASLKMAEECLLASYNEAEIRQIFQRYAGKIEITEDWFKRWYYIK